MAQRRSRRLQGLDVEMVPETVSDRHCLFCLTDENHGFNIIGGNVLQFPCCKKFAHRECQRQWELNSSVCPHCRTELPNERAVTENLHDRNREVSLRQLAINALQAAIQDREGLEERIDSVSLTPAYSERMLKSTLVGTHDKAVK